MFSFLISVAALFLGYLLYGGFVNRVFGPDPKRETPAVSKADGVDYIVLPTWKVFMIQFLNIAGTGPIFGAIMGAKFGPSAYLWIVFGCIFAGAVHDYMSGMLSLRHDGAGYPELVGKYLGQGTKKVMLVFSILLLLMVGAVFVYSPAVILGDMVGDGGRGAMMLWVVIIFAYYVVATLLPIDKIIGRIYPVFAFALLFMAVALMVCLFVKWPSLPEFWDGLANRGPSVGLNGQPIFPCLFITIDISAAAPTVVTKVSQSWLGVLGGILAVLGVVAAPITSGDTAFRSARLIIADFLHLEQKSMVKRLYIAIPLFVLSGLLLWYNISDANGFNTIWRYFGWANQTLSVFMFWTATVYLVRKKGGLYYLITLIPGLFMTAVCTTFILVDKIGLGIPAPFIPWIALGTFAISAILFYLWKTRKN